MRWRRGRGSCRREKMIKTILPCLIAGIAVTAYAQTASAETAEDVDPRIGSEVDRICFRSTINSWRTVDDLDDTVLLQKGVNDWYYVELRGGCSNRILRTALAIGIDGRPSGSCVTRGDVIVVGENRAAKRRCFIQRMYQWDDDAEFAADETEAQ